MGEMEEVRLHLVMFFRAFTVKCFSDFSPFLLSCVQRAICLSNKRNVFVPLFPSFFRCENGDVWRGMVIDGRAIHMLHVR